MGTDVELAYKTHSNKQPILNTKTIPLNDQLKSTVLHHSHIDNVE